MRRSNSTLSATARGFTLLELIITIAIAAILVGIAVPSYRYVTTANRISGEINGLLGDMQYARSEAIKEGQMVTICASSDGDSCSGSTAWNSGWIVYSGPSGGPQSSTDILRRQGQFYGGANEDQLAPADGTTTFIEFNQGGFASGLQQGGVMFELHDSTDDSVYTRCLYVTIVGSMSTLDAGQTGMDNGGKCT